MQPILPQIVGELCSGTKQRDAPDLLTLERASGQRTRMARAMRTVAVRETST